MTKSALSERLQDPANWAGTDDDVWYMQWRIKLKWLFAYGPRATEWYAKWREFPKTLFAVRSNQGIFRIETEGWERDSSWDCAWDINCLFNTDLYAYRELYAPVIELTQGYLSRIQYYTRWSFQIQWPLMIAFHCYFRAKDVPVYGQPRPNLDNKLFFAYIGAHRDGDKVYWFPSAFIGLTWK
jgi:hypothetical protein